MSKVTYVHKVAVAGSGRGGHDAGGAALHGDGEHALGQELGLAEAHLVDDTYIKIETTDVL
jgi:hypothetical protein